MRFRVKLCQSPILNFCINQTNKVKSKCSKTVPYGSISFWDNYLVKKYTIRPSIVPPNTSIHFAAALELLLNTFTAKSMRTVHWIFRVLELSTVFAKLQLTSVRSRRSFKILLLLLLCIVVHCTYWQSVHTYISLFASLHNRLYSLARRTDFLNKPRKTKRKTPFKS